jgi:hypothetical protein
VKGGTTLVINNHRKEGEKTDSGRVTNAEFKDKDQRFKSK